MPPTRRRSTGTFTVPVATNTSPGTRPRRPLLLLIALLGASFVAAARAADKPNVVVILADDMGYGDPSCYNPSSKIETPHIDRLAREGMRFTDVHAPGSLCVPSRYGLLTGRYPFRKGRLRPGREAVITAGRATIASVLRDAGYATAMIGKWHLGFDDARSPDWSKLTGGPVDRGFDSFFGIPASLDIPPYCFVRDRGAVKPPADIIEASGPKGRPGEVWTKIQGAFWRRGKVAAGFHHADVLPRFTREATDYIGRRAKLADGQPFFLYVALPAPHTPWLPLERFRGKSGAGLYGDFVLQVDDTVGRILAALDANGLAKDTLVFFTSDNGPVWYPKDVARLGHSAAGELRGMKADAWEGGHRMPFIARWPGHVEAESTSDQTLCFVDMMATLAAIAGVEVPTGAGEDSCNFLPVLLGTATKPVRTTTILKQGATVVRQGRWKLITHLGSGGFSRPRRVAPSPGGPKGQLYDLDTDLGETKNLWTEKPEIVERLLNALAAERAR